ncbi:hypothetical protein GCM10023176_47240 [Micromonospora coerulea]|uniref:Uncharacterized protein n=1 Tax=Micromonospora coerulea TaxID=47856 RepID=A0ABP8SYQ1_9ACTN
MSQVEALLFQPCTKRIGLLDEVYEAAWAGVGRPTKVAAATVRASSHLVMIDFTGLFLPGGSWCGAATRRVVHWW